MELLVYKASAGSGKTFTLAVEYIRQLILNPRSYQQILAVTFTNKATAEMKERILSQLYGIWIADEDSDAYLKRITQLTGMQEKEIRIAAGQALRYMLHDYTRFRIETIDSFFQSVMRNLARELELSPNLNIELNNEEILDVAVDSMIEKLTPTSPILAWLLDYIDERIADDKKWNVANEIKRFGKNIFSEEYIEKGSKLREKLKDPNIIKRYKVHLNELQKEALEQMKGFSDQFEGELERHGLSSNDLKNGAKGIGSYFKKLYNGNLSNETRNVTVEKCLESEANWAAKSSPRFSDITSLAASILIPILQDAEELRTQNNLIVNSCSLSLQHLNKLQLLASIDEEVRFINKEKNSFLLSDTNALLHNLIKEDDSSFVFEKIGTSIRNVMIDEFQDTSRMQWNNFKLLLLEGLSRGADSLIVGDVKQSIYRWRSGDWSILNNLNEKIAHFPIRVETLKTNRRSEVNVINFNNSVFQQIVAVLDKKHQDELGVSCESLVKAYADVVQEWPNGKEEKGYVKVSFIEDDDENSYSDNMLSELGKEVKYLLASGVKMNDIAILVRTNKMIPLIATYFDENMNFKIVSDEAFRLDASLALCMLINALRLLSDRNNTIALSLLALSYQRDILKQTTDINRMLTENTEEFLPKDFISCSERMRLMPLYELLEELYSLFSMDLIEKQDAYVFAFFDSVIEYLKSNSSEIDNFIRFWDEKLCSKTIPGGEIEGIRILSIHKSKGLEFHTVLVPYCDWPIENEKHGQLVWCFPETSPFDEIDIVPVNYSRKMSESIYNNDYLHERLQQWVDNINLLYVAFTRAGKNLIVWGHKKKNNSVSELLLSSFLQIDNMREYWDDTLCSFEYGNLSSSEIIVDKEKKNKLLRKSSKRLVKMLSVKPDVEFRQSNKSADFISGVEEDKSDKHFINRGKLLHSLFSVIGTDQDIEGAIQQLIFEGVIDNQEIEDEIRKLTEKAFSDERIKDWYSGAWILYNECAIIYKQDGALQIRRPDRVMMKDGEVVIVDFKFGRPNNKYNKQVVDYMQLLSKMGYEKISGYLWYVEEGRIEQVKAN